MRTICVFCGSSVGVQPAYAEAARLLGRELVRRGIELVYGGGNVGLMGVIADAVLEAGGRVTGVIPDAMVARDLAHAGVQSLRVVRSMHERKALMADLADGFVAMPGGYGTFEELCEAVTWTQLGLHAKPCGLLNVAGYYDPLLALFDRAVRERFVRPENRRLVVHHADPAALLDALKAWHAPDTARWITADEA